MSTPAGPAGEPAPGSRPRGIAFLLSQVGAHAAQRFAERVGELGVSPSDVGLLRLISAEPGRSQRSLAEDLGVVPSRVVALVDALERKGLVERRRSPRDRRNQELHLTAEGARVMAAMPSLAPAHEDEICAPLDREQRALLASLLEALAAHHALAPGVHPGYRRPSS
ncbi:MarR family winged helix-turn-helix transcriptional regulator [Actinocorallia libanotica]|uniref:HTH marR-type domain-containing protein n=1 Tax=Actinocorallia libanotica TaxID=46162 RepID=A0ABP4C902_9ACTN